MSNLKYNFKVLQANPNVKVQLEGHCDERGTAEYNMALGAERAKSVQDLLKSYGMNPNRLQVISYGEELPLEMGSSEFSYSKNRRVHFSGYTR
ncbi:UNVERIFIED_CONTAM: hypothetical protein GTU68_051680 [Idotea baltica]|nr:hypothetical protein [Idotea baltica]